MSCRRTAARQGLDKYNEPLSREYTGFLDNIEEAGFVSPFESGRVRVSREDMRLLMQEQTRGVSQCD